MKSGFRRGGVVVLLREGVQTRDKRCLRGGRGEQEVQLSADDGDSSLPTCFSLSIEYIQESKASVDAFPHPKGAAATIAGTHRDCQNG